jgi:hypothetical protein
MHQTFKATTCFLFKPLDMRDIGNYALIRTLIVEGPLVTIFMFWLSFRVRILGRVANLGDFPPKNANLGIFWPLGN